MSLVKYDSRDFMPSLFNFESLFTPVTQSDVTYEVKDDKIYYEVVIPGFEKEEIEIDVKYNKMEVKAKNDKRSYKTAFTLFRGYEKEPEEAKLKNGILTIAFNKTKEEKGIKISIQ